MVNSMLNIAAVALVNTQVSFWVFRGKATFVHYDCPYKENMIFSAAIEDSVNILMKYAHIVLSRLSVGHDSKDVNLIF